jgi:Arc/MetJ-type ribon-helix-helix transcriptional regulator
MTEQEKAKWILTVPLSLDKAIKEAILKDSHATKSEFIRDAVRRRLEEMGYNPQVFPKKSIEVTTE